MLRDWRKNKAESRRPEWLLLLLAVLTTAALTVLYLDYDTGLTNTEGLTDFGENLLAEATGVLAESVVVFFLVSVYMDLRRKRRLAPVRQILLHELLIVSNGLIEALSELSETNDPAGIPGCLERAARRVSSTKENFVVGATLVSETVDEETANLVALALNSLNRFEAYLAMQTDFAGLPTQAEWFWRVDSTFDEITAQSQYLVELCLTFGNSVRDVAKRDFDKALDGIAALTTVFVGGAHTAARDRIEKFDETYRRYRQATEKT
ncbi:MAG: hypothetical protein ACE5GX_20315 [Thermoanaerobaculia bacterium]